MNAIIQLALADFRERVRRFSFLVIVALAVFLGYQVISGLFELRLDNYRGLLNAAWIGTLMALTLSFFLSLIGFYVVRGNVQQDYQTGVGQILAATPLSKPAYVIGKFVSNTAVLLAIVGVLSLAALAMLLIHGEDRTLNLYQLVMPFLVFSGPVALLVAAMAVLFECTPFLRESAGNVIYFFLWMFLLPVAVGDLLGFEAVQRGMGAMLLAQGIDYQGGIVLGATDVIEMQTFLWTGFDWVAVAGPRLIYGAAALLLVALAALPFDRFDPTHGRIHLPRTGRLSAWWQRTTNYFSLTRLTQLFYRQAVIQTGIERSDQLTPVTAANNQFSLFAQMVAAEFKLLLKGRPFLWYAVAIGLILACLLAPLEAVRRWLLPLVWLWPLLLWSEMGVHARRHRVDQLLFSAPSPLWRQLPATWTAGVLLFFVVGSGGLIRFLAEPALLPGFLAGALFIPSLALLLGVVGGTERPLQILLLIWWYLGPMNSLAAFDITGATGDALAQGIPWFYTAVSLPLLGLTLWFRRQQMQQ